AADRMSLSNSVASSRRAVGEHAGASTRQKVNQPLGVDRADERRKPTSGRFSRGRRRGHLSILHAPAHSKQIDALSHEPAKSIGQLRSVSMRVGREIQSPPTPTDQAASGGGSAGVGTAGRTGFSDVLRNRNFAALFGAEMQSIIGDQLARVALS